MQIHQIITRKCGEISHREVSCLCQHGNTTCQCYDLKHVKFLDVEKGVTCQFESADRHIYFSGLLQNMRECLDYEELKELCQHSSSSCSQYPIIHEFPLQNAYS